MRLSHTEVAEERYHHKPLYVLYSFIGKPRLRSFMMRLNQGKPTLWGFSVYRRSPGYRTDGTGLAGWLAAHPDTEFFTTEAEALTALALTEHAAPEVGDLPTETWLKKQYREGKLAPHSV